METDSLAAAPRWWVDRQHLGVWMLVASYVFSAVAILAEVYRGSMHQMPPMVMHLLRTVPLFGLSVAVWMLTSLRPHGPVRKSKLLVRWGFVVMLVLAVLMPLLQRGGASMAILQVGWTAFFTLLIVCWMGLGCILARVSRLLELPKLALLIWIASVLWSVALIMTASFYVFREFTERMLFTRAEPVYVNTLLAGGLLLMLTTLALAVAFTLRTRRLPTA